jgi:hypothetical protein
MRASPSLLKKNYYLLIEKRFQAFIIMDGRLNKGVKKKITSLLFMSLNQMDY